MRHSDLQKTRLQNFRVRTKKVAKTHMVNIAIVDDHNLFRKGICSILKEVEDFSIVIETESPKELLEKISNVKVDVAIVDIKMPELTGFELTEILSTKYPDVKVIALSMFNDETPIIRMLRAGAKGYLVKGCEPWELKLAVKSVYEKGFYNGDVMSRTLLKRVSSDDELLLRDYEISFINHCCTELTYKEIASEMGVSPRTNDGYRDRIFEKLNVRSRTGLVLYALKSGICIPD